MPQPERNTTGLADAAERRHHQAVARARSAIRALDIDGEAISFQSVARRAGVSRQFLYSVPELRGEIERLRSAELSRGRALPAAQRSSETSLKARNQTLLDENHRLRDEITGLRDELAGAWGELRAARRARGRTGPTSVTS
jgi:uncharacterized protein DUF6262